MLTHSWPPLRIHADPCGSIITRIPRVSYVELIRVSPDSHRLCQNSVHSMLQLEPLGRKLLLQRSTAKIDKPFQVEPLQANLKRGQNSIAIHVFTLRRSSYRHM
jgi:hypothetical protein